MYAMCWCGGWSVLWWGSPPFIWSIFISRCEQAWPIGLFGSASGSSRMPKSQIVAQHVPYLRRYARALTGNQTSGDSYVAATLEALVKDPRSEEHTSELQS